jgi:hypothetical protein
VPAPDDERKRTVRILRRAVDLLEGLADENPARLLALNADIETLCAQIEAARSPGATLRDAQILDAWARDLEQQLNGKETRRC